MAQLNVGQLQTKVDDLKAEFDLQRSIKDNTVNAKIQRSRDKICDILRKIQNKRPQPSLPSQESEILVEDPPKLSPKKSLINKEVLDRRNYIFQFKMFLKRKKQNISNNNLENDQSENQNLRLQNFQICRRKPFKDGSLKIKMKMTCQNSSLAKLILKRKAVVHNLQIKQFFHDNPLIMFIYQLNKDNIASALDTFPVTQRFHFTKE
ncbi:hypothetical protein pb186bvf_004238 [Paramecium bursaria]